MSLTRLQTLQSIDAQTLKQGLDQQTITLIDVREPAEFAGEHIPGATLMPLSRFDPQQLPQQGELVLYCRSGNRSTIAAQKLFAAGFEQVTHLDCGIEAWKEAGYPIVANQNAPISIMRQVQITAGALILIGTVLGAVVSPWFLLLSGAIASGLIFAGITDTCALGMLLAKLPYNQRSHV